MGFEKLLDKKSSVVLILALLVFVPYLNSLFAPFMWDDNILIVNNPGVQEGWKSVATAFSPSMWGFRADEEAFRSFYRPLHSLHSILDYRIWGLNPFGFHLSNTVVHLINTVLLYFFVLRISGEKYASFVAASVFAVHPAHTETVVFISARPHLLSSMFLLASFHLYLSSRDFKRLPVKLAVSFILFLLALLSSEMAVMLPVLISLYALLYEEKGGRIAKLLPYFIILALYGVFRVLAMSEFAGLHRMRVEFITLVYTAAVAVLDYTRLLIFPYPLQAYYPTIWYEALSPKAALALVLIAAAAAASVFFIIRKKRLAAFALIWMFVSMTPVLNIGSLGDYPIAERYLYIPSIGFSILVGWLAERLGGISLNLRRVVSFALPLLLIVLGALTIKRNAVWTDDVVFFTDMAEKAPQVPNSHANLAKAYFDRGKLEEAASELEKTVVLAPRNPRIRYELGFVYAKSKRYADAIVEYKTAIELKPDYAEAYNSLGIAYGEMGMLTEAEDAFKKAVESRDGFKAALSNIDLIRRLKKGKDGPVAP